MYSITWVSSFNQAMRKYGLSISRQRLLHFFVYVTPETGNLHSVKEINDESKTYTPYYRRGLIQLTHLGNYLSYGRFRKSPATVMTDQFSGLGWDSDALITCNNEGDHNTYNYAGSACFYVAARAGMLSRMDAGVSQDSAVVVSKDVNGNVGIEDLNGFDARLQAVLYPRNALLDDVFPDQMLPLTFEQRRNTQKEPVFDTQRSPVMVSNPPHQKKKFHPTQHTISISLELQKPQSLPVKEFVFASVLVTPMVTHMDISSEIVCLESGGIESINFEIKTYYGASTRFLFGFVRYRNLKKTVPIILNRSIGKTLDKNIPDRTANTWTKVYDGRVTGECEMIPQGADASSMIYTGKQGGRKIASSLNVDAITLSGCQWQIFMFGNQRN